MVAYDSSDPNFRTETNKLEALNLMFPRCWPFPSNERYISGVDVHGYTDRERSTNKLALISKHPLSDFSRASERSSQSIHLSTNINSINIEAITLNISTSVVTVLPSFASPVNVDEGGTTIATWGKIPLVSGIGSLMKLELSNKDSRPDHAMWGDEKLYSKTVCTTEVSIEICPRKLRQPGVHETTELASNPGLR